MNGTTILQSESTELDELVLLVSELNQNQREYLFALARGENKEDARQAAGVQPATVASWPYQGRTADEFKRIRDILRQHPKAWDTLLNFFIRRGTQVTVAKEVWENRPRTDVLRLGAEMGGLLDNQNKGPGVVNIIVSQPASDALTRAAQEKWQRLQVIDLPGENQ